MLQPVAVNLKKRIGRLQFISAGYNENIVELLQQN